MGVLTSFLKLFKPAPNDYVDVEKHLNENYDKIDEWAEDLIVNDLTTGGADKALSGEMGKKIWTDRNKTNTYTASNNKGEYYGEFQGNYDGARLALQRTDGGAAEFIGMTIGGTTGNTGLTRPIFRQRVSNNVGELLNNTFELFHQGNYDKNLLLMNVIGLSGLNYIETPGNKTRGECFLDKTTKKIYICYPKDLSINSVDDVTVTENFINISAALLGKKFLLERVEGKNNSWYEKYSDGTLLQGFNEVDFSGQGIEYNFLTNFKDIDYNAQCSVRNNDRNTFIRFFNITNSSIGIASNGANGQCSILCVGRWA